MNDRLSAEERDILIRFERGDLRSAPGLDREVEVAREAARNTFNKTKRVNLRVTERDCSLAHARARERRYSLSDAAGQCYPQVPVWRTNREEVTGHGGVRETVISDGPDQMSRSAVNSVPANGIGSITLRRVSPPASRSLSTGASPEIVRHSDSCWPWRCCRSARVSRRLRRRPLPIP